MTGEKEAINANGSLSAALRVSVILKFCKEERKQLWVRESWGGLLKKKERKEEKQFTSEIPSSKSHLQFGSGTHRGPPLLPGELGAEHDSFFSLFPLNRHLWGYLNFLGQTAALDQNLLGKGRCHFVLEPLQLVHGAEAPGC